MNIIKIIFVSLSTMQQGCAANNLLYKGVNSVT